MGVPAFFRWLSVKYPSIVVHCVEDRPKQIDDEGQEIPLPVDSSKPNPNGVEFDNLYLDMNGIIHPCTHPENKPAPRNEAEMFVAIFECIDRLFGIVRPRKLLYMAIDGVAPRAKMNQQRSRRFRAGKEAREKEITLTRLKGELRAKGAYIPEKASSERFDSNCITPGTPFFARLTEALHYYIHERLNSDPGWRNVKVVLSDANVPGEGEHKIMDYIRRQRVQPTHDPNTKHCLCGADADLIMLGLATHEPHFTIIREEFKPNQPRPCELCSQMGHEMGDCVGAPRPEDNPNGEPPKQMGAETEFIFIRLNVLREYLTRELKMDNLPFPYDFERAVDDWVFMCFFVGNDFLPHLPSLEIREKAIDRLVELYKSTVYRTGGWLTDSGKVNLPRVQLIMQELGEVEDQIFKKRRQGDLNYRRRQSFQQKNNQPKRQKFGDAPSFAPLGGQFAPTALGGGRGSGPAPIQNLRNEAYQIRTVNTAERNLSNLDAAHALKAMLKPGGDEAASGSRKRKSDTPLEAPSTPKDPVEVGEEEDARDEVKLWEDGWRDRYYQSKFGVDPETEPQFCVKVAHEYVRGLCWVLAYYYQGCANWKWYFPYHYAPFASDVLGISDLKIEFERGTQPFNPLEQLMGVFPADSKEHVPEVWQHLMENPNSPIIDFYPTDFKIDLNGKKYAWQGVALLPFVDEKRLLDAVAPYYSDLPVDAVARNVRGPDRIFIRADHPAAQLFKLLYPNGTQKKPKKDTKEKTLTTLDPGLTHGSAGKIWADLGVAHMPGDFFKSPIPLCDDIPTCHVVSACYLDPEYSDDYVFPAKLLKNVVMPEAVVKPDKLGGGGFGRGGFGGGRGGGDWGQQNQQWRSPIGMAPQSQGGGHRDRNSYDSRPMQRMARGAMGNSIPPPVSLMHVDVGGGYNRSRGGGNQYGSQGNYGGGSQHVGSYSTGRDYANPSYGTGFQQNNQYGGGGGRQNRGGHQQRQFPLPPQYDNIQRNNTYGSGGNRRDNTYGGGGNKRDNSQSQSRRQYY